MGYNIMYGAYRYRYGEFIQRRDDDHDILTLIINYIYTYAKFLRFVILISLIDSSAFFKQFQNHRSHRIKLSNMEERFL